MSIYFRYVVAANGKTVGSDISGYIESNHEEADISMVHCVTHLPLTGGTALISSNDTDVFVLFVSLLQDLPCQKIIMKWSNMWIDLTGNDVVEKF